MNTVVLSFIVFPFKAGRTLYWVDTSWGTGQWIKPGWHRVDSGGHSGLQEWPQQIWIW